MDDFFTHLESVGVSFVDSPPAADYAKAKTEDELRYAAGEHLALHRCVNHDGVVLADARFGCPGRHGLKTTGLKK